MLSDRELRAKVQRLQECWCQRSPVVTEDPIWREIFTERALAFLHAGCVAGLKFPEWQGNISFVEYVIELERRWAKDESVIQKGVRAGAVLPICPDMIHRWADNFLKNKKALKGRRRQPGSAEGQIDPALKPKGVQ